MDIHEDVGCDDCPWSTICSGVGCEEEYIELTVAWKEMSYHKFIESILDTSWSEYDLFDW